MDNFLLRLFMRIFIVFILLFGVELLAFEASFDCKKARLKIEKMICKDEGLATYDKELSKVYRKYRDENSKDEEKIIKKQRKWNKRKKHCLFLYPKDEIRAIRCLKDMYASRIDEIKIIQKTDNVRDIYTILANYYKDNIIDTTQIYFDDDSCRNDEYFNSVIRGTTLLFSYYYALRVKYKNESLSKFNYPIYSNDKFLFNKILNSYLQKNIKKYLKLAIREVKLNDLVDIENFLKELNNSYKLIFKGLSIDEANVKGDKDKIFIRFKKDNECLNNVYLRVENIVINGQKTYYDFGIKEFLDDFWMRRATKGDVKRVKELLDFVLKSIKEYKNNIATGKE